MSNEALHLLREIGAQGDQRGNCDDDAPGKPDRQPFYPRERGISFDGSPGCDLMILDEPVHCLLKAVPRLLWVSLVNGQGEFPEEGADLPGDTATSQGAQAELEKEIAHQ